MDTEGVEYILTATSWRDAQGVRHRRGDVVTPPASEVERLLRAKAIATLESIAEAQAAAEAAREATIAAAQAAAVDDDAAPAPADDDDQGGLDDAVPPPVTPPGEKPRKVAPVKDWEDHAVRLYESSGGKDGLTREAAEKLSKAELIAKFG